MSSADGLSCKFSQFFLFRLPRITNLPQGAFQSVQPLSLIPRTRRKTRHTDKCRSYSVKVWMQTARTHQNRTNVQAGYCDP